MPFRLTSSVPADQPDQGAAESSSTTSEQAAVLAGLAVSSSRLGPLVKRHLLPVLPGQPPEVTVGWAQLPESKGRGYSLGLFADRWHFTQIAFVDDHARVFLTDNPAVDTFELTPALRFLPVKAAESAQSSQSIPPAAAATSLSAPAADRDQGLNGVHDGAIIGQDETGDYLRLAIWHSQAGRYDLIGTRAPLPPELSRGLNYRDAVAVAFFSTYLLPRLSDFLIGGGASNIFARLGNEAPLGAIRRSVADILRSEQAGLRVSGLEEHFAYLMHEVGALDGLPGLEAVHGAEPMHLFRSTYSGSFFLTWDNGLDYRSALSAFQIEGVINRVAQVSSILDRNRRLPRLAGPVEEGLSHEQVAQLDAQLLENPALIALPTARVVSPDRVSPLDEGLEVSDYPEFAHEMAEQIATQSAQLDGLPSSARPGLGVAATDQRVGAISSEWVYRQALASMIRQLRLPFRFDAEFRSNLSQGRVAIGFTTAGMALMPQSTYDQATGAWHKLGHDERASLSADYNLRVGLMLAALAFGADAAVQEVSVQIDSIGLEEAVEEQDSAIAQLLTDALAAFEQSRLGHGLGATGAKGDPKDGDVHGNPASAVLSPEQRPQGGSGSVETPHDYLHGEGLTAAFNDLMLGADLPDDLVRGASVPADAAEQTAVGEPSEAAARELGNLDESDPAGDFPLSAETAAAADPATAADDPFVAPTPAAGPAENPRLVAHPAGSEGSADSPADGSAAAADGESGNPLSLLQQNPTVRRMVLVVFRRQAFLGALARLGLRSPREFYQAFQAQLSYDQTGGLQPIQTQAGWQDPQYTPAGAQEEPELSSRTFDGRTAQVLGTRNSLGLSIQRETLLTRALASFTGLAAQSGQPGGPSPSQAAERAMALVRGIGDPELSVKAALATGALIDGQPIPDISFELAGQLNKERIRARDELFKGNASGAVAIAQEAVDRLDAVFDSSAGIPRYFNSYAERVVYNKLFAAPGETTVLIPDNLFYSHMELADLLAQLSGPQEALKHLNTMVSYAPAYPLSHLRQSIQLARIEDWDSARAATLNALRVALDRDDAAFAYYRFAYAAWMRDEFDIAAAAYLMSGSIHPGAIPALQGELAELMRRAASQRIEVPGEPKEAAALLAEEGIPVWPHTEVTTIVRRAARVSVDEGLFVPARTLALASARLDDSSDNGLDIVQSQFLRSLNA